MNGHTCFTDNVYVLDGTLLCAGCYARRALSVYGKEAHFVNGSLVMLEYKDLSYLNPANEALVLRAKLYKDYCDSKFATGQNKT